MDVTTVEIQEFNQDLSDRSNPFGLVAKVRVGKLETESGYRGHTIGVQNLFESRGPTKSLELLVYIGHLNNQLKK